MRGGGSRRWRPGLGAWDGTRRSMGGSPPRRSARAPASTRPARPDRRSWRSRDDAACPTPWDRLLPHPLGNQPASLEIISQLAQQSPSPGADSARSDPIDAGGSCTLVGPHPAPRHDEESRVIHEVVKVIEATVRVGRRPLVQLRLHLAYPPLGLNEAGPRRAGVHRRPPQSAVMLRTRWAPSPCGRLSRPRTTTSPPPHPSGIGRRRTFPPTSWWLAGEGTAGVVPTFTP
jgi:hypothetical protein